MPPNDSNLRKRVWAWLDGSIDPNEFEQLTVELRRSDDSRRVFAACAQMHAALAGEAVTRGHVVSLLDNGTPDGRSSRARLEPVAESSTRSRALGIAVLAVAATLATVWLGLAPSDGVPDVAQAPATMQGETSTTVATIGNASSDCVWFFERRGSTREPSRSGSSVHNGSAIRVVEGELRLDYRNGTVVRLVAPALYEPVSDNRARVLYGKCRATVSPAAIGFALETPHATVTDMGTEFGLEVDDRGEADVVVFDGAVDVDFDAVDGIDPRRESLLVGEAFRVGADGAPVRLSSIRSDKFAAIPPAAIVKKRPPVIVDVRDNLQQSWKFYEIVHAGMAEDAKAFNDLEKEHEWNGLTRLGMPAYLVGADYVRMFKGDQIRDDIEVRVTLDRPADLYILFDERVPEPNWLTSDFERTGDRIGLDMGPWDGVTGDEYANATGPGRSIDRVAVVWRSRRPRDGVVALGSTETSQLGTEMYGIVARPCD